MVDNFREFSLGPDPFGRTYQVRFLWIQNGISIRHADTVDVKFVVDDGELSEEKVIAIPHPLVRSLADRLSRPLNDAWCSKLAAAHLAHMADTGEDIEKTLVTLTRDDLERANKAVDQGRSAAVRA